MAEEFDVDPNDVVVTFADSQHALPGTGPGGSRYTVMVSGAVAGASAALKQKILRIASDQLEAAEIDLEFRDGGVGVKGAPDKHARRWPRSRSRPTCSGSTCRPDMESGLATQYTYDHPLTTLPNDDRSDLGIFYPFVGHAWHIAVVEVDPETGKLTFLRYAAVHDAGTIVNPRTLDGQIIGGTVQGLGSALYEEYRYDEQGRVRNENFETYHLPSSMDVPTMTVGPPGDAVAVHALRHQGRRRGRPHADAGDPQRGHRGRARALRGADHVAAHLGGADRRVGGGGEGGAVTRTPPSAGVDVHHPTPVDGGWWAPRRRMWWIAILFAIGSTCFLVGPFPGYAALGRGGGGRADVLRRVDLLHHRGGAPVPGDVARGAAIVRWASIIQFAGTLEFNRTTFQGVQVSFDDASYDRLVWTPDAVGSICFLVSGAMAYVAVGRALTAASRWRDREWQIAAVNLLGCIAFGVAAIASYVVPDHGSEIDLAAANLTTAFGGLCFLIGSLLLLPVDDGGQDVGVAAEDVAGVEAPLDLA